MSYKLSTKICFDGFLFYCFMLVRHILESKAVPQLIHNYSNKQKKKKQVINYFLGPNSCHIGPQFS